VDFSIHGQILENFGISFPGFVNKIKIGDFMMVTDLRFWWQNHYVGDFFRYVGDFFSVFNRSPTSQTCHQHIWSPTSVTNIDVTSNSL